MDPESLDGSWGKGGKDLTDTDKENIREVIRLARKRIERF